MGDWMEVIRPSWKSRANTFQVFGVLTVALSTSRLRTSSEESARSARKFWLSCGISTKLGLGPSSMLFDQV